MTMQEHEEEVRFQIGGVMLAGTLTMPERALGIVLFAHQGFYADGMVEHDGHVGQLLKKLGDLGIADNTIVIYSTDNGPHYNAWPDAAVTPFRGEKNTNWEGGYSVPCFIRWTGKIPADETFNGIVSAEDWLPTPAPMKSLLVISSI
jgi:membrane-anchored protein YejM (alkaline phosphatase superfamily)